MHLETKLNMGLMIREYIDTLPPECLWIVSKASRREMNRAEEVQGQAGNKLNGSGLWALSHTGTGIAERHLAGSLHRLADLGTE